MYVCVCVCVGSKVEVVRPLLIIHGAANSAFWQWLQSARYSWYFSCEYIECSYHGTIMLSLSRLNGNAAHWQYFFYFASLSNR